MKRYVQSSRGFVETERAIFAVELKGRDILRDDVASLDNDLVKFGIGLRDKLALGFKYLALTRRLCLAFGCLAHEARRFFLKLGDDV